MNENMRIEVFVENEAGSKLKNTYNEETLVHLGSREVQCAYPYSYGFVLNTKSGDGDALDCHIICDKTFRSGEIVVCEPIGVMEQIEDELEDHKILAIPAVEHGQITTDIKRTLTEFAKNVFSDVEGKRMQVGTFADQIAAMALIKECQVTSV